MSLVSDLFASFQRMPVWVQIWVAMILMPVNLATLLFLGEPYGLVLMVLAIGGILPNLILIVRDRAMSTVLGVPHTFVWPFLVGICGYLLLFERSDLSTGYALFVLVLLLVDGISLIFDANDTKRWLLGDVTTY